MCHSQWRRPIAYTDAYSHGDSYTYSYSNGNSNASSDSAAATVTFNTT